MTKIRVFSRIKNFLAAAFAMALPGAAFADKIGDRVGVLVAQAPAVMYGITSLAFITGVGMAYKALMMLKKHGEDSSRHEMKPIAITGIVAAALLSFSGVMLTSINSIGNDSAGTVSGTQTIG